MSRKICVVTGSRADYGLLRWVMQGIKDDAELQLQVIATGMHLSPTFGLTVKVIEKDGFEVDRKIEILGSSDTPVAIAESMALALAGCAKAYFELKPDLVVVLGDRFEIFAAAAAALVSKVPIAHVHGGESTSGAFDEAFRHSITKMSQLHFVSTEEYKNRVIQLGEHPQYVYLVGGLGIDNIRNLELMGRKELESQLGIEFGKKSLLITFHPVTLDSESPLRQMKELFSALSHLHDTTLIFTMSNADTGGNLLNGMVEEFVRTNDNAKAFTSLGQLKYLSCLKYVDGVIGNSSSGITEVPSFKKGTINIGDRQLGRILASSVINCEPHEKDISQAIERLYSPDFKSILEKTKNPYGDGGASTNVVKVLKETRIEGLVKKTFYDL